MKPLLPPPGFLEQAAAQRIAFDAGDLERLGAYLAMLLEANTRFNLTAVRDPDEAWTRHVLDSLALLPLLESCAAQRIIDVGSGAGLPGLPLAIVMPSLRVTLLEATGKKARFMEEAARDLRLESVVVINDRAETVALDEQHRQRYDVVTARAVGPLNVLLELTVPLARVGGLVLAIKGRKAPEEIAEASRALRELRATVVESRSTPTSTVVVIEKQAPTPNRYPRRPGEPKRAPLRDGP